MEFRQLSYFVAVVEAGSISAASRRVHIAQPALTRQIKLLEEDLDTRLFERHARGMQLTVAGRKLYEEALALLDARAQIRARLTALGQGVVGKVSLGVTVTHLWVSEVAGIMRRYRDRYPEVAFEIYPLLSGPQLERLQEGSLDAGILYLDDTGHPGLETRLLQHNCLILAVPEASPWAAAPPTSSRRWPTPTSSGAFAALLRSTTTACRATSSAWASIPGWCNTAPTTLPS